MQYYKDRQIDTEETLQKLKELIHEINQSKKEQIESGLNGEVFAIYWIHKKNNIADSQEKAQNIAEIFQQYCHWKTSEHQERSLKKEILKALNNLEIVNYILSLLKNV